MIPKIIHQTFASTSLPASLAANIARLRDMNTGWEHRFYDDAGIARYIGRRWGADILAAYNRINPAYGAARADLFRYLLLYEHGGVYLDIKSSAARPFDEVIAPQDTYLLAHWPNRPHEHYPRWGLHKELRSFARGEFQQWHIIAAAKHPYLRSVIQRVLHNIAHYDAARVGVGRKGTLRVTGPIAYSLAILPQLHLGSPRIADSHDDFGLVYNIFDAEGLDSHKKLFARHYTKLKEPVVLLPHATPLAESRRPIS